jgi:hypothetical protein
MRASLLTKSSAEIFSPRINPPFHIPVPLVVKIFWTAVIPPVMVSLIPSDDSSVKLGTISDSVRVTPLMDAPLPTSVAPVDASVPLLVVPLPVDPVEVMMYGRGRSASTTQDQLRRVPVELTEVESYFLNIIFPVPVTTAGKLERTILGTVAEKLFTLSEY